MFVQVSNPLSAVCNNDDYNRSTRLLAATTLRNVLGTRNLGDILADREAIAHEMQTGLDEATDPWGVLVERVEVKDVSVPQQLQRSLASVAEAQRESRAKVRPPAAPAAPLSQTLFILQVIAAEGELQASRSLAHAAQTILDSPQALQLRFLQTLNNISEDSDIILFPLPLQVIQWLTRKRPGNRTTENTQLS